MECSQEAVPCKERWTAAHVDAVLHSERYAKDGQNILRTATLETLPHGVIVALDIVTTHDTLPDSCIGGHIAARRSGATMLPPPSRGKCSRHCAW